MFIGISLCVSVSFCVFLRGVQHFNRRFSVAVWSCALGLVFGSSVVVHVCAVFQFIFRAFLTSQFETICDQRTRMCASIRVFKLLRETGNIERENEQFTTRTTDRVFEGSVG